MAVKKAISSIDLLIQEKKDFRTKIVGSEELPPLIQGDMINRFDRAMWSMLQGDIEWLQTIKRQLLPDQHRTKIVCRHPKKDHDTDGSGQKYCMNCNANLPM